MPERAIVVEAEAAEAARTTESSLVWYSRETNTDISLPILHHRVTTLNGAARVATDTNGCFTHSIGTILRYYDT